MKKVIRKTLVLLLPVLLGGVLTCEGLYDMAKNGVPVIYAFVDDGMNKMLVVTNGDDYLRNYTTDIVNTVRDMVVIRDRKIMIVDSVDILYTNDEKNNYSSWIDTGYMGFMPNNMICAGEEVYVTGDAHLYRYNDDSWYDLGSAGMSLYSMYCDPGDRLVYIAGESAGTMRIFSSSGGAPALFLDPACTGTTIPFMFLKKSGNTFYFADNVDMYWINDTNGFNVANYDFDVAFPADNPKAFCVTDDGYSIAVMRNGGSFTTELWVSHNRGPFQYIQDMSSGNPDMIHPKIVPFGEGKVVIGIRDDMSTYHGAYIYNYKKNSLSAVKGLTSSDWASFYTFDVH